MGCTDPLRRGVGAPHQCPLGSVASYLIYTDVRSILMVLLAFKGVGYAESKISETCKQVKVSLCPCLQLQSMRWVQ